MSFFFRHVSVLKAVFPLALACSADGRAADAGLWLTIAPPAQATPHSCQSYVIAAALAMANTERLSRWWEVSDVDAFRDNELEIRKAIEREMRIRLGKQDLTPRDSNTRGDWANALKRLTFGQFKLGSATFSSLEELMSFLANRVQVTGSGDKLTQLLVPFPTTLYFTSVSRIDSSVYKQGHVVIVLGVQKNVRSSYNYKPDLLFLNSAVKGDDNECLPAALASTRWFGSAGWTDDYEIKLFDNEGKSAYYVVNWIERASSALAPSHKE